LGKLQLAWVSCHGSKCPFSINRRDGELRKGFQGSEGEEIERREKEEEERRGNEVEALPNRDCDQSLRCSLFGVLRATID